MVIIESVIKSNALGRWYIELSDTTIEEDPTAPKILCADIQDYAKKIAIMGEPYGGEIEVAWSSADGVSVAQIHEVRQQIMAYEAEVEAENT